MLKGRHETSHLGLRLSQRVCHQPLPIPTFVQYDRCSQLTCFAKQVHTAMETETGVGVN